MSLFDLRSLSFEERELRGKHQKEIAVLRRQYSPATRTIGAVVHRWYLILLGVVLALFYSLHLSAIDKLYLTVMAYEEEIAGLTQLAVPESEKNNGYPEFNPRGRFFIKTSGHFFSESKPSELHFNSDSTLSIDENDKKTVKYHVSGLRLDILAASACRNLDYDTFDESAQTPNIEARLNEAFEDAPRECIADSFYITDFDKNDGSWFKAFKGNTLYIFHREMDGSVALAKAQYKSLTGPSYSLGDGTFAALYRLFFSYGAQS